MMRFLFFLLLFLPDVKAEVPHSAHTFDFNVSMIGMSRNREDKLSSSIEILRKVFSSQEFRRRIISHRYKGRYRFAHNQGLSNLQIYHRILAGAEKMYPRRNNTMDVEVGLYTDKGSNVLGYTYPRSRRVWMNTKYYNRHSSKEVASHLMHEWLHKLGFEHERQHTRDRKYSVPYAIGYIVKDLAKKYRAF